MQPPSSGAPAGVLETVRAVVGGQLTARAATEEALARIAQTDPPLNAISAVLADRALAEADARDASTANPGPLHGVPLVITE
jgi:Asp-tRNA(Asn)/Glu-tRNA(Gln) amidotransferase A subunit family amidase